MRRQTRGRVENEKKYQPLIDNDSDDDDDDDDGVDLLY